MQERRKALRVSCSISLNYRVLDIQDFTESFDAFSHERKRMIIYDKLKYENRKLDFKLQTSEDESVNYLFSLNKQLSLLTELLSLDVDTKFEYTLSDTIISVAGMSFYIKDRLDTGVMIEMQLHMSPNAPRILVIAEVINCSVEKTGRGFRCSVSFSFIDKEDKEKLAELVHATI